MLGEFSPLHRPPVGGEYYVFRDVVHNLIEIEDADDGIYVRDLLRTPEAQRMRRIRQNGLGSLVYSSLETTRFPHALGSFHIARRIATSLFTRQPNKEDGFPNSLRLTERDCFAFSLAGLLHDIGHGPLSHVWEELFPEYSHEKMGTTILADPSTAIGKILTGETTHPLYHNIGNDVLQFIQGKHHLAYLLPLLEGNLDVDRLDFISRDTRSAGVTYGFHELEWIIRSFRFARLPSRYLGGAEPRWVIAIDGRKGLSTLIQFLHARENMYRLVYHHKTTRAATQMLILLFKRARTLARNHKLPCRSTALCNVLAMEQPEQIPPTCLLRLDDSDIWASIKGWAEDEPSDAILKDLAQRLLSRDLFKVFLLNEQAFMRLKEIDSEDAGRTIRAIVKARLDCTIEEAEYYYAFDSTKFDVIGRPQEQPWLDVWIMQSGALGFEFRTLRDYWRSEVHSAESATQYLLVVHRDVVQDLTSIVERLSFPTKSAEMMKAIPKAPSPYRVIAPLGAEGTWKEVWVGTHINPGSDPEKIVALKRYKTAEGEAESIDRDVHAFNLLTEPHPNLSSPRLLRHSGGETWIVEPLWVGSLEDLVQKHGPRRDIMEIFEIAHQLFAGLASLHAHKLRHTDIKPENCGIMAGVLGRRRYVLGDFGCLSSTPDRLPTDPRLLGTLRTRAPEVISGRSISTKSDVWAMAATIYALCLNRYPFMSFDAPHHDSKDRAGRESNIKENLDNLVRQHRESVEDDLPPILADQLRNCFESENQRPTAQQMADSMQSVFSDLSGQKGTMLRTAWQRAEDVACRFSTKGIISREDSLSKSEAEEAKSLMAEFAAFVPKQIARRLKSLTESS